MQLPPIPSPGRSDGLTIHPDNADNPTGNPEWDALSRRQQEYYQGKHEEGPATWGVKKTRDTMERNEDGTIKWKSPTTIAPRLLPSNARFDENRLDYVAPKNKPVWKLDDKDTIEYNKKYTKYDPATGNYNSPQTVFNKSYQNTQKQRADDLRDHGDADYNVKRRQDLMYGKGGILAPMNPIVP